MNKSIVISVLTSMLISLNAIAEDKPVKELPPGTEWERVSFTAPVYTKSQIDEVIIAESERVDHACLAIEELERKVNSLSISKVVQTNCSYGVLSLNENQSARLQALDGFKQLRAQGISTELFLYKDSQSAPNGGQHFSLIIGTNHPMGECELFPDGSIRLYNSTPEICEILGGASEENPAVIGHLPFYYQIGDIKFSPYDPNKYIIPLGEWSYTPNTTTLRLVWNNGSVDPSVRGWWPISPAGSYVGANPVSTDERATRVTFYDEGVGTVVAVRSLQDH